MKFPTREELSKMSLDALKNVYISNLEQEKIVQELVNKKTVILPPIQSVDRHDVPLHIKTKEEEEKWQKIIDERTAKLNPQLRKYQLQDKLDALNAEIKTETEILEPEVQAPIKVSIRKTKKK